MRKARPRRNFKAQHSPPSSCSGVKILWQQKIKLAHNVKSLVRQKILVPRWWAQSQNSLEGLQDIQTTILRFSHQ
jgi:hypothetical protein